jgi:hypothetical protein
MVDTYPYRQILWYVIRVSGGELDPPADIYSQSMADMNKSTGLYFVVLVLLVETIDGHGFDVA